jgi:hypothetical protein
MCNECPLKCEVRREIDGRNIVQIIQCKGGGVGEPSRSCKQQLNNINIFFIPEVGIPMLEIQVDSNHGFLPIHCGSIPPLHELIVATKKYIVEL